MKSVLISIRPYYVFLIIAKIMGWETAREKVIEARKSYPKAESWNKVVKIYCSKDRRSFSEIPKEYQPLMERFLGKVMGEFICDQLCWVLAHPSIFAGHPLFFQKAIDDACLTQEEVDQYANLWNLDFTSWNDAEAVKSFKRGEIIEVSAIAIHPLGSKYYLTEYSYSKGIRNGFNTVDCDDYVERTKKSIEQVAQEIVYGGPNPWGNDPIRTQLLTEAGYTSEERKAIQNRVNQLLR